MRMGTDSLTTAGVESVARVRRKAAVKMREIAIIVWDGTKTKPHNLKIFQLTE